MSKTIPILIITIAIVILSSSVQMLGEGAPESAAEQIHTIASTTDDRTIIGTVTFESGRDWCPTGESPDSEYIVKGIETFNGKQVCHTILKKKILDWTMLGPDEEVTVDTYYTENYEEYWWIEKDASGNITSQGHYSYGMSDAGEISEEKWLKEIAADSLIGTVSTELGELSFEQVLDNEAKKNVKEGTGFVFWFLNRVYAEGTMGSLVREMSGIESPFTFNSPKTSEFFNKIDQVSGNEIEKIKGIYSLTTEAVPGYGAPGSNPNDLSKFSTFEEALSCGSGICRDQAALLTSALQKQGIDARMINGSDHSWVRVELNEGQYDGKVFDLDPTWYKDFVPLPNRS